MTAAKSSVHNITKKILVLCLIGKLCATELFECESGNGSIENGTYILVTCILKVNVSVIVVRWSKSEEEIGRCYLTDAGGCIPNQGNDSRYRPFQSCNRTCFSVGIKKEPSSIDFGEYYISLGLHGSKTLALNHTYFHRDDSDSVHYTSSITPSYTPDAFSTYTTTTPFHSNSIHALSNDDTAPVLSVICDDSTRENYLLDYMYIVSLSATLVCSVGISLYLVGRKICKLRKLKRSQKYQDRIRC